MKLIGLEGDRCESLLERCAVCLYLLCRSMTCSLLGLGERIGVIGDDYERCGKEKKGRS